MQFYKICILLFLIKLNHILKSSKEVRLIFNFHLDWKNIFKQTDISTRSAHFSHFLWKTVLNNQI